MKIIIETPKEGEEETITIRSKIITENIHRAIDILKTPDDITVFDEDKALLLPLDHIFYVESVDLKTFVCCENKIYRSKLKLYEVEKLLQNGDFLRISKQTLISVKKIKSISPLSSGKFLALLSNEEKVVITRKYVPNLKARFGL